jgi:two-component system, NarL family, invasion response regulator UvrY
LKNIKVMLVDDHALVREGLKEMLDQVTGIKVVSDVSSGEEAISEVKEIEPDVILMDVRMPGIGGLRQHASYFELTLCLKF